MVKVIYRLFPKDYCRYIEVFGGGGAGYCSAKSQIKTRRRFTTTLGTHGEKDHKDNGKFFRNHRHRQRYSGQNAFGDPCSEGMVGQVKIRKNADQNKKHDGTVARFTQEKINRCGNQQKQKHGFTDRMKCFEDETLFLLRRQLVLAILFLQFLASPTNLIGSSPAQFVLWIYMQCKEILQ